MDATEASEGRYRIADVARRTGFSASALRYYEQAGVLAAPERTPAGHRLYADRDVERLRLVARAKDLGCTLDEIAALVEAWDGDQCGPVKHRLRGLVDDKVAQVEALLVEQSAFAAQLRATAAALADRPLDGPCEDSCGCTADTTRFADATAIACSLVEAEVGPRVEQWEEVLADVLRRAPIPGGLRLELGPDAALGELAELVGAEQRCCPFFSFAITADHRGVALEVTAPADGQGVLSDLFGSPLSARGAPVAGSTGT